MPADDLTSAEQRVRELVTFLLDESDLSPGEKEGARRDFDAYVAAVRAEVARHTEAMRQRGIQEANIIRAVVASCNRHPLRRFETQEEWDARQPPSTPTGEPPPKRDMWALAERVTPEVAAWPEWKRRAADQALVTTGEPGATEGPARPRVHKAIPGPHVSPDLAGVVCGRDGVERSTDDDALVTCKNCRAAAPTVEPPEPDEDRTLTAEEMHAAGRCAELSPCEHGWPGCSAPTNCPKCVAAPHRARAEAAERERDEARTDVERVVKHCNRIERGRDEARERAAAGERDLDTLRALLKRCEPVITDRRDYLEGEWPGCARDIDILKRLIHDIRTALHQSKGAEP